MHIRVHPSLPLAAIVLLIGAATEKAYAAEHLAAARHVADHIVLKPQGFVFAPHPVVTETDCDKYCVRRIVDYCY